MDYGDDFYRNLKDPTDLHQHFIYWVRMTDRNGNPNYGGTRQPLKGDSPIHDVLYATIYSGLTIVKSIDLLDKIDKEAADRLQRLTLIAGQQTDVAAMLGSTLLTLEDAMVRSGTLNFELQLHRMTSGRWSINTTARGDSLLEAAVEYFNKKAPKLPPPKQ